MNHPISILYLEDSPRDVELVRERLQSGNLVCELRIASGRAEYEAALAAAQFDLILSDFALPDYDGMTALVLAQAKQPAVPFILISGTLGEEQAVDCILRGATDYVMKQRLHRLVPAVTRALNEARERQQRQAAEAALRASEEYHRNIIATAMDGFWLADRQGRLLDVNAACCQMLGYTRDELLTRSIADIEVTESSAAVAQHMQQIITQGPVCFETRHRRKDGTTLNVEASVQYKSQEGGRFIMFMRDITARKQTMQAFLDSEQKFRSLYVSMTEGVALHELVRDAADQPVDYVLLDVNPAFEKITGLGRELVVGRRASEVYGTGAAPYLELYAEVATTGRPISFESLHEPMNKAFSISVFSPAKDRFATVFADITARKQAEAELQLQGSALNAAANAIVITDPKGDVVWANPAFTKLTGYEVSEVLGKNPRVLKSGQHDTAFYRQMWETICAGLVWSGEIVNKRKDGSLYTEEMTITPVSTDAGVITHYIAIKQDITARKRVEHALEVSNRQLVAAAAELGVAQQQIVQQASLRALGQMASGIAHDFNNALSPIIGFSEFLLKHPAQLADQEKAKKFLTSINTCGQDAANVVRRLREFGRQRVAGQISEAIDLPGLVLQIIDLTQPRWQDQAQAAGVTINIATDLGKVPIIAGEEFAIRELLTNLIFNAVDALPAGGTITLGTAVAEEFVRVWVSDTGTGMTEEVRQRCFEPFFTTKDDKGTGLGLAMVHGIVQRHGGTVEVESQLGQGTTFTIRLPLKLSKLGAAGISESVRGKRLRVLVVDNEPMLREIVDALLTDNGHIVATAESGEAALQRLQSLQFDLVITDKAMPRMNGEQMAVAIHAVVPNLPVILMTGFGDLMKVAGEMPPHIRAILSKPITEESLRAALAKVFSGK